MNEYTVVVMRLEDWQISGKEIKDIISRGGLKWRENLVKELKKEEVIEIYKRFRVGDIEEREVVSGKEGMWDSGREKIKIVISGKNIVLIYKGGGGDFYIKLMKRCKDMGFLIMKIVDGEIVFKDQINVRLLEMLNDDIGEMKIREKLFLNKVEVLRSMGEIVGPGENYSDKFIAGWRRCIHNG